jgi:hypothetical protein
MSTLNCLGVSVKFTRWNALWQWDVALFYCAQMMWSWLLPALGLVTAVNVQTATAACVDSLYQGPLENQKGRNTFRISFADNVVVDQCLADCTANVNCVGISHEAGDNYQLSYSFALWHRVVVLH